MAWATTASASIEVRRPVPAWLNWRWFVPQGKEEAGPLPFGSFGPNPPAVPVDYTFGHCQANAEALELALTVHALECAEQHFCMCHIETNAVIPHKIDRPCLLIPTAEGDTRRRLLGGEFPGVLQ
jgi:hypothetical protein